MQNYEKKKTKEDILSASENFREAYLKEKHSSAGLEALANFMNVSVDLGEFEESIKYYKEEEKNFDYNEKLLKALSRIYQFSIRNNERKKILERIIKNKSKSLEVWCSYIYINNFENIFDQKKHYEIAKEFSKQIEDYGLKKIKLDENIKKRKIALGFLTADFHGKYSLTYFLKGLIKNINKNKFHLIGISNRKINDESRKELKPLFDELIEINSLDDLNAINFIRQKKLDIIFDIMGVTSKTRIVLFKNKISVVYIHGSNQKSKQTKNNRRRENAGKSSKRTAVEKVLRIQLVRVQSEAIGAANFRKACRSPGHVEEVPTGNLLQREHDKR